MVPAPCRRHIAEIRSWNVSASGALIAGLGVLMATPCRGLAAAAPVPAPAELARRIGWAGTTACGCCLGTDHRPIAATVLELPQGHVFVLVQTSPGRGDFGYFRSDKC